GHAAAGHRHPRTVSRSAGRRAERTAAGAVPGRHRRGAAPGGGRLMQNVNLFQPDAPQARGPGRRQMLLGLLALLGLMLLHGVWAGWDSVRTTQALERAERQARELETQLLSRQASFREPQLDTRLSEQLSELESGNQRLRR